MPAEKGAENKASLLQLAMEQMRNKDEQKHKAAGRAHQILTSRENEVQCSSSTSQDRQRLRPDLGVFGRVPAVIVDVPPCEEAKTAAHWRVERGKAMSCPRSRRRLGTSEREKSKSVRESFRQAVLSSRMEPQEPKAQSRAEHTLPAMLHQKGFGEDGWSLQG